MLAARAERAANARRARAPPPRQVKHRKTPRLPVGRGPREVSTSEHEKEGNDEITQDHCRPKLCPPPHGAGSRPRSRRGYPQAGTRPGKAGGGAEAAPAETGEARAAGSG